MTAFDPSAGQPRRSALRLMLEYRGAEFRLTSRQEVEMVTPPSDPTDEYEGQSGAWLELRDARERVIYRRIIRNPLGSNVEAPSGDPKRPFTNVRVDRPSGALVLVVPDLPDAVTFRLLASVEPDRAHGAELVLQTPLRAQRRKE